MLRTMLVKRSALLLLCLIMPTSMAGAGPIFTHAIQPAGASPWVQGGAGVVPMAWSSTGLSGVVPGDTLWVDVLSSPAGHALSAPSRSGMAVSAVGNPPANPTAAASTPVSAAPATESSAASSPASAPFVPVTPGASGIDVPGRVVDGLSTAPAPPSPSSRGYSPGQHSTSPGSPSTYQASTAGLADSRSARLASGATNSIAASQGPTIPAAGGATTPGAGSPNTGTPTIPAAGLSTTPSSAGSVSLTNSGGSVPSTPIYAGVPTPTASLAGSIPQATTTATAIPANGTTSPQAAMTTTLPGQGAAVPAAGGSPMPGSSSLSQGITPSSSAVAPSLPQTSGFATPTTSSAVVTPQDAGAASSISTTSAAILSAASSIFPPTNPVSQASATPAANGAGGTGLSSTSIVGLSPAATTLTGNATPSGVPLVATSNNAGNSAGTINPVGTLNATSLVPITPSPTGTATDPNLAVTTGQQLNSAIGGSSNSPANPAVAAALLAPTPLNLTTPLPPPQVAPIAYAVPGAGAIGIEADPAVLPQNLPEPGGLAVFSALLVASALKMAIRRLRTQGVGGS
jgi:hypothetical protein